MLSESSLQIEFDRLYESQILPNIEEVEKYRLKQKWLYNSFTWISIIGIFSSIVCCLLIKMGKVSDNYGIYCIAGFVAFILFLPLANKVSDNLRKVLKMTYLTPILDIFGLKRSEFEEITLDDIKNFGLFPKAVSKKDDDVIVGDYKGIPLVLTEAKLTHSVGSGKSSRTVTDFSGLIIKMAINRNYSGILVGNKKGNIDIIGNLQQIIGGATSNLPANAQSFAKIAEFAAARYNEHYSDISNKFRLQNGDLVLNIPAASKISTITSTLKNVNFDNADLNQNCTVYSDNAEEAKNLITSYLTNKISNLDSDFIFSEISFVINGSDIYLFLSDIVPKEKRTHGSLNGFFELGDTDTSLLDKNLFFKVFKELSQILSFVEGFKFYENKGL